MADETRPDEAEPDPAAFDRKGQDAIEGRGPERGDAGRGPERGEEGRGPERDGGPPGETPPAGPHAAGPLTSDEATPGTGALPSGGDRQGEADPAVG